MSSQVKQKVFEVRDGTQVLGQFSQKARAQSFRKTCTDQGVKTRIYTVFVSPKESGASVPKKTAKAPPKPKEVPKPPPKERPKPKATPKTAPKSVPKEPVPSGTIDAAILKTLESFLDEVNSYVPVYSSDFCKLSPDHIMMARIRNRSGRSLFGFEDKGDDNTARTYFTDLHEIAKNLIPGKSYSATVSGSQLVLTADGQSFSVPITQEIDRIPYIKLKEPETFTVDPIAFRTELRRCRKILNGGIRNRQDRWGEAVRLYGRDGDLMMWARNQGYGMDVDIGDGRDFAGSSYSVSMLEVLCDLFLLADSPCRVTIDRNSLLVGDCSIGDFDVALYIAARMDDD